MVLRGQQCWLPACRHHFGGQAKLERVLEELQAYSDFELHDLARSSKHYAGFCLEDSRVLGAAKCQLLAELLPRLQVNPHCRYCQCCQPAPISRGRSGLPAICLACRPLIG